MYQNVSNIFTRTANDAYIVIACDVSDGTQITGDVEPLSQEKSKKYINLYFRIAIFKTQLHTWRFMEFNCPLKLLRKQNAIYVYFHAVQLSNTQQCVEIIPRLSTVVNNGNDILKCVFFLLTTMSESEISAHC